jgi:hypothetical protein
MLMLLSKWPVLLSYDVAFKVTCVAFMLMLLSKWPVLLSHLLSSSEPFL